MKRWEHEQKVREAYVENVLAFYNESLLPVGSFVLVDTPAGIIRYELDAYCRENQQLPVWIFEVYNLMYAKSFKSSKSFKSFKHGNSNKRRPSTRGRRRS